jgi:hypothetical protein
MRLFLIRYTKIIFCWLQLHRLFNFLSGFFLNAFYLTKLSKFIYQNRKIPLNDFPTKWNYEARYPMYQTVLEKEISNESINYLEFGVASGESFRWFLQHNHNPSSRFYGFDTFSGLPEDWGPFKKGAFSTGNKPPEINDNRAELCQGLFQQTLSQRLKYIDSTKRTVLMMDADLYSATLFVLSTMAPFLKAGDLIFFDQFAVPTHEFRAYFDFTRSFYMNLELIAAANNFYFVAFKVV